jgi:hypothetical protein
MMCQRRRRFIDLSECVVYHRSCLDLTSSLQTGLHIADALSASGLRALRFALEVPNVERVVANDFSDEAVAAIQNNIRANNVGGIVESSNMDAWYVRGDWSAHTFITAHFYSIIANTEAASTPSILTRTDHRRSLSTQPFRLLMTKVCPVEIVSDSTHRHTNGDVH